MVVPRKLFKRPNSCSVATVMDTLVAVIIVPINNARKNSGLPIAEKP